MKRLIVLPLLVLTFSVFAQKRIKWPDFKKMKISGSVGYVNPVLKSTKKGDTLFQTIYVPNKGDSIIKESKKVSTGLKYIIYPDENGFLKYVSGDSVFYNQIWTSYCSYQQKIVKVKGVVIKRSKPFWHIETGSAVGIMTSSSGDWVENTIKVYYKGKRIYPIKAVSKSRF